MFLKKFSNNLNSNNSASKPMIEDSILFKNGEHHEGLIKQRTFIKKWWRG